MRTDAEECDCTQGLLRHWKTVCTGGWLGEKNPLSHQGLDPKSVLCLAFQSDALPVQPSLPRLCTVSACVLTCGLMVLFVAGCLQYGGLGLGTVCPEL